MNADDGLVFDLLLGGETLVAGRVAPDRVGARVGRRRLRPAVLLVVGPGADLLLGAQRGDARLQFGILADVCNNNNNNDNNKTEALAPPRSVGIESQASPLFGWSLPNGVS